VDCSGKRIAIGRDPEAEIFVGVLGASNLTYPEATWRQKSPDWTDKANTSPILELFLSRLDEITAAQSHAPPSPA
jgi:transposase